MAAVRQVVMDSLGLGRNSRAGDNPNTSLLFGSYATDANGTLTMATIAGGGVIFSGQTAGRSLTTDTAANILAQLPNMDIGDSVLIKVSVAVAFAITWVAGTAVTLAGKATAAASSYSEVLITKTGAATVTWTQL